MKKELWYDSGFVVIKMQNRNTQSAVVLGLRTLTQDKKCMSDHVIRSGVIKVRLKLFDVTVMTHLERAVVGP